MKLSIAWIFDHLEGSWQKSDVRELAHQLTMTTAEIERVTPVSINLDLFSIGRVTGLSHNTVTVESEEWGADFSFPRRDDAHEGKLFLITKKGWATIADLQGSKEGLFPAVEIIEKQIAGGWKKEFEAEDYILEIDNVALTHRPDLWSHQGFAREIAAITGMKFVKNFGNEKNYPVHIAERIVSTSDKRSISVEVEWPEAVPHFAGLYIKHIENGDCVLPVAHRLARIDARPINAIVDATNYVMYDIGQPLHAFDARDLKKIIARAGKAGEKLLLLDGTEVALTGQDIVIADEKKPLALAGIMGGATSGVNSKTESIFIEAPVFNSRVIRATSTRTKKRTDGAVRHEKGREPGLNVEGITRFLKLFHDSDLAVTVTDEIITIGNVEKAQRVIEISHAQLESKIGIKLQSHEVKSILEKLEFEVVEKGGVYQVTVPRFRNKDVQIPEDLVEEVVRSVGYNKVVPQQPALELKPHDIHEVMTLRKIKDHLAFACSAHEVSNYSLYDEPFLQKIGWSPDRVPLKNPVSEHYQALVTSLVPHLLKAVETASHTQSKVRFFEWNKTWIVDPQQSYGAREQKTLAAIFFDKSPISFYEAKAQIEQLFHAIGLSVTWKKLQERKQPWWSEYETAALYVGDTHIGHAGLLDAAWFSKIAHGHAFAVELNGDALLAYRQPHIKFKPLSKYPAVWLDISMLVPLSTSVAHMEGVISSVDSRIISVSLVDFFEKKEWGNQRSITLRYVVQDSEKTLEKQDIAAIEMAVAQAVKAQGAQVR
jgi:phenylalanyl-tRNA synthetase beta chain